MSDGKFEIWKDGEIVTREGRPGRSTWSRHCIDEVKVRAYSLVILRELERHLPGNIIEEKHKHMEEIICRGSGFSEWRDRTPGRTAKELLGGNRSITFNTVKRAQRWLYDHGKAPSAEMQEALANVAEVQFGRFLVEMVRFSRSVERKVKKVLLEAEMTPDPDYARHIIADILGKLIPEETRDHLVASPRMKSY